MNVLKKILNVMNDSTNLKITLLQKFAWLFKDDKEFLQKLYVLNFGYTPDFDNPQTFNEKLNWIKLHDRKPIYTKMADKYNVKQYVAGIIGDEYVVPCYGVYDSFDDIDFSNLPDQFVMKATHDSGGATVCRDKKTFDYKAAKKKFELNLKRDYFLPNREWPYKDIPSKIIIDKYLDDHTGKELRDYKFWCINGIPTYMYCTIKGDNVFENFYDMNFRPVMIDHGFPRHSPEFEKPAEFELMKTLASKLAKEAPAFIRIDFFDVDGHVYFGEFTFYDWAGLRPFKDYETDLKLGEMIHLI